MKTTLHKLLAMFLLCLTFLLNQPILAAVEASASTVQWQTDSYHTPISHPYLKVDSSNHLDESSVTKKVRYAMNEPVFPKGYPWVRLFRMEKFRQIEEEFTKLMAGKVHGKSAHFIANFLGAPLMKTGQEGYGEQLDGCDTHWIYSMGFNVVLLDLGFKDNQCISAKRETSPDAIVKRRLRRHEFIVGQAIGCNREQIKHMFGATTIGRGVNNNKRLSPGSLIIPNINGSTEEFVFHQGKCSQVNQWIVIH